MNFCKKRTYIITFLALLSPFAAKSGEVQKCPMAAESLKKGDYQGAYNKAGAGCPTLKKLALWYQVKDGHGAFAQYEEFMRVAQNWPWTVQIRKNAEFQMHEDTPLTRIAAWFKGEFPKTYKGFKFYLLTHGGDQTRAIKKAFHTLPLNKKDLEHFISQHRGHLNADDYQKRANMLLDKSELDGARNLLSHIQGVSLKRTLTARLKFMEKSGSAESYYETLPAGEQKDPGVLSARLTYLAQTNDPKAYDVIAAHKDTILQDGGRYLKTLHRLARDAIPEKKADQVLLCLEDVTSADVNAYSEAQWLLGWTHLKMLNAPEQAVGYFESMYPMLKTGTSRSKFAYWTAKSYDAMGQKDMALTWLAKAAQHPTCFYGQLAHTNMQKKLVLNFKKTSVSHKTRTKVDALDVVKAIGILAELKKFKDIPAFIYVSKNVLKTFEQKHYFVQVIKQKAPRYTVEAARVLDIHHSVAEGFPRLGKNATAKCAINPHLAHAIIRKESCFDPNAVSSAGAMGLMQLMPDTARKVAKTANVPFKKDHELLTHPHMNVTLGTHYFAQQLESFGQNPMVTLAAYNAGPGNARKWQKRFGDPTQDEIDVVDWIELIPFWETRAYVQRVWESYKTYEALGNH